MQGAVDIADLEQGCSDENTDKEVGYGESQRTPKGI